jgi:hypothetical protein
VLEKTSLSIERSFLASSGKFHFIQPVFFRKFMFYSVVLLDGKELQNLSLEQVKDLFFKRQLNQNSLICTNENPNWQMLKRGFDLSQWIPSGAPPFAQNNFQPQNNPFAENQSNPFQTPANHFQPPVSQPATAFQPVTFNQFPANPPAQPNNPFGQNTSNGYSQNNQTETYYQAETNQTNYNFQNNQSNFAPSKYSNPANSYNYSPNSQANSTNSGGQRKGLRQAAVFLIANAILNIIIMLMENLIASAPGGYDDKIQGGVGRFVISLVIDLVLAVKLWKNDEAETARKWVLARTYLGFILFGVILPVSFIGKGEIFVGVFNFIAYFLFLISIMLVLHGKQGPTHSRVMVGMGTFAVFFLFNFGAVALGSIVMLAPNMPNLDIQNAQLEKYKIEGKEFQDKTTGAKVVLPEGWSMLKLDNPVIHTPEARMIAVDKAGNRLTMLEVVPVPGNLDMKRQNSTFILDQLSDGVVQALQEEVRNSGGFGGGNSVKEITRISIFIGTHPAKLLVFDKTTGGAKTKGHLIITYDELTFYVLHSWCPVEEYEQAQTEFTFFEKNFTVPEKLNSTFTQSAENDKKR